MAERLGDESRSPCLNVIFRISLIRLMFSTFRSSVKLGTEDIVRVLPLMPDEFT